MGQVAAEDLDRAEVESGIEAPQAAKEWAGLV